MIISQRCQLFTRFLYPEKELKINFQDVKRCSESESILEPGPGAHFTLKIFFKLSPSIFVLSLSSEAALFQSFKCGNFGERKRLRSSLLPRVSGACFFSLLANGLRLFGLTDTRSSDGAGGRRLLPSSDGGARPFLNADCCSCGFPASTSVLCLGHDNICWVHGSSFESTNKKT